MKKIIKSTIVYSLIGLILVYILPSFIYFITFRHNGFSKSFADWVNFSSYLNGFLSPLFAGVNVIALIILSIVAYKLNEDINDRMLSANKQLEKWKLKHLAYNQLNELNDKLLETVFNLTSKDLTYEQLGHYLLIFERRFENLLNQHKKFFKSLDDNIISQLTSVIGKLADDYVKNKNVRSPLIDAYFQYTTEILSKMQNELES